MTFGIFDLLTLIGSLGFFIYGMKIMSEGIQKAAGNQLRQILAAMTKNRFFGLFTGFLITAIVQSSSATTVMTVSFVNAGLMTLVESAGIMMGANIGTTITAWLVSLLGFKVKIASISLPVIAFGLPMLFARSSRIKSWGEFLIGFALLFMGLELLKSSVPDVNQNPQVLAFVSSFAEYGFFSRILFVLVGALLTVIIQSSSATMTLTITMCYLGYIPFEIAAPMVLGENIGTTITAELASIVGNVHAKRSARIHSLFNIIGVTWMIMLYPFFLDMIDWIMTDFYHGNSPFTDKKQIPIALSYFHTMFNVSNALLLIGFVPALVKLSIRTVKSKGEDDEVYRLEFLERGIAATPEISLIEAKKETVKFGEIVQRMSFMVQELINEKNKKEQERLIKKIIKYENITDRMEKEIAGYLAKVSEEEMSGEGSMRLRGLLSIINDLERIGDQFYQMTREVQQKNENKYWFSQDQRDNLNSMFELLDDGLKLMLKNLDASYEKVMYTDAENIEKEINYKRDQLRKEHLSNLENGEYPIQSGMVYNNLFMSIEKVGDHIMNVSSALTGRF